MTRPGAITAGLVLGLTAVASGLGAAWGPMIALAVPAAVLVFVVGAMTVQAAAAGSLPRPAALAPASVAVASAPAPAADEGPWTAGLGRWMLAIVAFRVVLAVVVNATIWNYFAPDGGSWALRGELVGDWWLGNTAAKPMVGEDSFNFYLLLNAGAYMLMGANRYPVSLLNTVAAVGVALLYGQIAFRLYGRAAARLTFFFIAVFPSLVLWTSMNVREVWAMLAIGITVQAVLRIRDRFSPAGLAMALLGLFWLYTIRAHVVAVLLLAITASLVVVRVRQLPYAAVGLTLLVVLVGRYGQSVGLSPDLISTESLETIDTMRRGLSYGGSAYGADVDTTTVVGALTYLPEGIVRFLCSPFPWSARSARQLMTVPESMVWYYLLIRGGREMVRSTLKSLSRIALLVFFVLTMVSVYGLVSGNEGTAYRHRAQVMTIIFIFSAADIARRRRA